MIRLRNTLVATLVLAGSALGPARVDAQFNLSSSMDPTCLNPSCTQVEFLLDVFGTVNVTGITFQSLDATLWKFAGLASVFVGASDVTYAWAPTGPAAANGTNMVLASSTFPVFGDPIRFIVDMLPQMAGLTVANLSGKIQYDATGEFDGNVSNPGQGTQHQFSTGGIVTVPEPGTLALLALGLFGVAVMNRRSRETFELA